MSDNLIHRLRFYVDDDDPRPVEWPLPDGCCYWISGVNHDGKSVLVAYMRPSQMARFWPDAEEVGDLGVYSKALFTDRFPRPDYFAEPTP